MFSPPSHPSDGVVVQWRKWAEPGPTNCPIPKATLSHLWKEVHECVRTREKDAKG